MAASEQEEWRWTEEHGRRLKEARVRKGIAQKKTAALLGVTDDTLRNWETGATQPREEFLAAIADFCEVPLADLIRTDASAPPVPSIEQPEAARLPPARAASRTTGITVVLAVALAAVAVAVALSYWRRTHRFQGLRSTAKGIEAMSRSGRVLWQAVGVEPSVAERWALVRFPGGRTLLASVLTKAGDYRPEAVSTLSFVDPNATKLSVVETARLPLTGWKHFPTYARRYELAYINAVDLNDDGIDEILATYQQVPECVSYTILYEPVLGQGRIVFVQTGAHHFTGAWDLDGDGRRELLFLGINNGYNWMNALAAIRLDPPIGAPLRPDDSPIASPDSRMYTPRESALHFYALLPRGRVPDDPKAVTWDNARRVITVRLLNGRVVNLTARGFPATAASTVPEADREAFRRQAYRHNREARRLNHAGFSTDAVAEGGLAVVAAERSQDGIALEAIQRDVARFLIAAGHVAEGEALGNRLAQRSENASEIFYDIAVALHLAGNLRRAVSYYEAGIRRGGSPEEGKSKHEFIQGLALAELRAFDEALRAVDRFRDRYVTHGEDWTAMYREFIRWRTGQVPDLARIHVPHNATDLLRYWMLEFANARGDDTAAVLRKVEALLAENNQPRGGLLSLHAVLLDRMGRRGEAAALMREAMKENASAMMSNIIVRGHADIVATRSASLDASAVSSKPPTDRRLSFAPGENPTHLPASGFAIRPFSERFGPNPG
jgi:transcriptional regulator with XRE-family HTH domain/tetratricopeptide (TPR) repeat protein